MFHTKTKFKKIISRSNYWSLYFDTKKLDFFNLSEEGLHETKSQNKRVRRGILNNLEIKTTNNYHREKIVIKEFNNDNYNLHSTLRKLGISSILQKKLE